MQADAEAGARPFRLNSISGKVAPNRRSTAMNEPYFYANLAHHLAFARRSNPGLWARLRAAAPERLREGLPYFSHGA